jgi:hypothetical protein
VFPNPTQAITEVHFEFEKGNPPTTLIIYNSAGYVVRKEPISNPRSKKESFNVTGLPKGLYFVSVINSKSFSQVIKLVVQ